MQGTWGHTATIPIFIPDKEIISDRAPYFAVPLRGNSYVLAVYDKSKDKIIGWIKVGTLGYKTVKEFMNSPSYYPEKIAQFTK
jgi:hypothetical protein